MERTCDYTNAEKISNSGMTVIQYTGVPPLFSTENHEPSELVICNHPVLQLHYSLHEQHSQYFKFPQSLFTPTGLLKSDTKHTIGSISCCLFKIMCGFFKSSAVAMQLLLEFHICLYDKSVSAVTNLGKSCMVCFFQMGQYTVT